MSGVHRRRWLWSAVAPVVTSLIGVSSVQGRIVHDGTAGAGGALSGPNFSIPSSRGEVRGGNLFHSFSRFNVKSGESATFTGPASIRNVLARVTGGTRSEINGILRIDIAGANLFLINPAGVVFRADAALDVSGSFHVSTADSVRLGAGQRFDASRPEKSLLGSAPPSAFGFLTDRPAAIRIEGTTSRNAALQVSTGKSLSLIGGPVRIIRGGLVAPGGAVNVAAASAAGDVEVGSTPDGSVLTLSGELRAGSDILLDNSAVLTGGAPAGPIDVRGRHATLRGSVVAAVNEGETLGGATHFSLQGRLSLEGSAVATQTVGGGRAGDVRVAADSVRLTAGTDGASSGLGSNVATGAAGDAGNVRVSADRLTLGGGSLVSAATNGAGNAGDIRIAAGRVWLSTFAAIEADTSTAGRGGDIRIDADSLRVESTARISTNTSGSAPGGAVRLRLTDALVLDGGAVAAITAATDENAGAGGSVRVVAGAVRLVNGGQINTVTIGPGAGGGVSIRAADVRITGTPGNDDVASVISSGASGNGNSGGIRIEADSLSVTRGGAVNSSTAGAGNGGNIRVIARDVLADSTGGGNAGLLAVTLGIGNGGIIRVLNAETLTLRAGGVLSSTGILGSAGGVFADARRIVIDGANAPAETQTGIILGAEGFGIFGGGVNVIAESVEVRRGGRIDASTSSPGQAGIMLIRADDLLLRDRGSSVASSTTGEGDAGGVVIQVKKLSIRDGATIASTTSGAGDGGAVFIDAGDLEIVGPTESVGRGDSVAIAARSTAPVGQDAGAAGGVVIVARRTFTLRSAEIAVSAENADAGQIGIQTDSFDLFDSRITAETPGQGGDIFINATNRLALNRSLITAESGNGGRIVLDDKTRLDPGFVILDDSTINGLSAGDPVLVRINPRALLFQSVESRILTNSLAVPPPVDIAGSLLPLASDLGSASAALQDVCAVRLGQARVSSFIVTGRGSFAPRPGGLAAGLTVAEFKAEVR